MIIGFFTSSPSKLDPVLIGFDEVFYEKIGKKQESEKIETEIKTKTKETKRGKSKLGKKQNPEAELCFFQFFGNATVLFTIYKVYLCIS